VNAVAEKRVLTSGSRTPCRLSGSWTSEASPATGPTRRPSTAAPYCHHRRHLLPPFKRRDTSYTYPFEQQALRLLIGSIAEEVARRLGVSAETIGLIARN
jgi:hypothetical protein